LLFKKKIPFEKTKVKLQLQCPRLTKAEREIITMRAQSTFKFDYT